GASARGTLGEPDRGGLLLLGLVQPLDGDGVAGVVLVQDGGEGGWGVEGPAVDGGDQVAGGQPCLCGGATGDDLADGGAGAAGVADAEHRVTDRELAGVAGSDRGQPGCALCLQDGDVVATVVAHHGGRVAAAVADVGDLDAGGALDHVVVGEHPPVGAEHHAGAGRPGSLDPL